MLFPFHFLIQPDEKICSRLRVKKIMLSYKICCIIFSFFLFSCGANYCVMGIGPCNFGKPSLSRSSATLTLTASANPISVGSSTSIRTTGGVSPYSFFVTAGTGTFSSSTPSTGTTDVFIPNHECIVIKVTDSQNQFGEIAVLAIPTGYNQSISISGPSRCSVDSINNQFSISGGSGNYLFSLFSGNGLIDSSRNPIIFKAPSVLGCSVILVTDANDTAKKSEIATLITPY